MKTTTRAALAATLVGLALPLHAQDFYDKRVYVAPAVTYTFDEKDRNSKQGLGFYFGGGKPLTRQWNAEFGVFQSKFDNNDVVGGARWHELGFKLDGQYFYSRERGFSPYFGVGAGVQRNRSRTLGLTDTGPMIDAGLGFISWLDMSGYDLGIRMDGRYRWAFLDEIKDATGINQFNEPIVKLGLILPIGGKQAAAAAVAVAAPAASGSKVLDSDGDGVPDALDRCPGTARGAVVDSTGCARDATSTVAGGERQFSDVLFEFDRSDITAAGQNILDNAAEVVNSGAYKSLRVNIAGHTDWIGSEGYNQALSERRANAVRSYLVKKGVDASRIHTFAYGEAVPKADNASDEGRALNRRAEIKTGE